MWRLRDFKRRLQKLWYWLPIIWKDRDYDDYYIFEILKHKLKSQAEYIGKRDIHTRAQQDSRRMKLCVSLIEKIQDETYAMEYIDYLKDEFRFEDCKDIKGYKELHIDIISENLDDYFKKYPLIYKRVLKGEGSFSLDGRDTAEISKLIAMNIGQVNQERAHKLLFKIMEENILGWWD